jgi:XTP/dITP diphosphohydrolase
MRQLLIATSNQGKFREFAALLSGQVSEVLSLVDFPDMVLPSEDGVTFVENAIIKARHAARVTGIPSLADDSGLEVACLDGRPGVLSARFAGESATDADNNAKLLRDLANVPSERRMARFVCCIAFCQPDGSCITFDGELPGTILHEQRGRHGFGYDPLFLVNGYVETLAELDMAVKNSISHRAKAFGRFRDYLAANILR